MKKTKVLGYFFLLMVPVSVIGGLSLTLGWCNNLTSASLIMLGTLIISLQFLKLGTIFTKDSSN
ncbi:MAG: hypothetical protein A3B99_03725 [Candidatus Yanofskybacteria bacterium RIFCSPHIGHO2_02_FULL_44_12b]|uniref:Uncharacterized protein n=2 Tax=Candidatus Yanofskyibacteriota TaxID=1752733 RepID=A0A1F8GMP6_9BACT|nr:MAG: hypothetical protein UW79_C0010G0007 [Candidatus Yanofskybacteria bacterium GW2011_GWA2_44_9]OGN04707.1 MAG: hypothetical protein A2659_01115 [Candidatus Yanofskybacteria bacterium RIFCSPHIGHO2_01_FULL_44_24]OGN15629.1 MAG: hypothetical protein A3B99_03725 [Candidatus Yanofskybacteria bacterium RIFCSPHIGHO2_02_FULL_44_12b]OGN26684.1 MAG: hypothetical protein A2925_03810 [Candidatus Yanofskybacteria bacterium RIFCSPLOWO2_01_FULL_44_22]